MSNRSVTRQQLASKIAQESSLTVKEANLIVDHIVSQIATSLASDTDVMISGFGKFVVQSKKPRMGRNPRTGVPVQIEARRVMKFHPCDGLRETVNSNNLPGGN